MKNCQAFTFKAPGLVPAIHMPVTIISGAKSIQIQAVWDTGAMTSCISTRVASHLGLVPIGQNTHHSASGTFECIDYIVDISLLNQVKIPDVRVSDFAGGPGIDALIGMDIITMGDLSITNAGQKTVMSFRIPPDAFHIDYVQMQKSANKNAAALKQFKKKMKKRAK